MNIQAIAQKATDAIYERDPELLERFGEKGKAKCLEDNVHHLKQLRTAIELGDSKFFVDYAIWLNGILTKHGMSSQHLIDNFTILQELTSIEPTASENNRLYLKLAIHALQSV